MPYNDIYINSVTGDAANDGSARKPFQTYAQAVASGISSGDTVWIAGTLTEQVDILDGVTYRKWGNSRFVVDAQGTRDFCITTPLSGANDFTIIGAELQNANIAGFAQEGPSYNGRLFDCFSHDNNENGFRSTAATSSGDMAFYGCHAKDNGNDGFSTKNKAAWNCYDCFAEGHDTAASTDGFTTHDDALINAYRCVSSGNTKGFSYTHNSGRCVVANCHVYDCEMGLTHVPSSTTLAVGDLQPSTFIYGSVISLNGETQNSAMRGVSNSNGAHIDCIMNTVYNIGNTTDTDRCYSFGTTNASNTGGMPTTIRVLGCVSEILADTEAFHSWAFTLDNVLGWDHNIYRSQTGDRFRIENSLKTETEWQDEALGLDSNSYFHSGAVIDGAPDSDADLNLGRISAGAASLTIPNLRDLLLAEDLDSLWSDLGFPAALYTRDRELYNDEIGPRLYRLTDSCAFMGVNGGPIDTNQALWLPGAFSEGAKTDTTHVGTNDNGSLLITAKDVTSGISDQRVNLISIAGDRTRRVRLIGITYQSSNNVTLNTATLTSSKTAAGKVVSGALANVLPPFVDEVLPPGEDLYLSVPAQAGAIINMNIKYRIETVATPNVGAPVNPGFSTVDA